MDDLTAKYLELSRRYKNNGIDINPNFLFLKNEFDKYNFFVMQGGTRCFAPEQRVVTKGGSKRISELKTTDIVKCYNEETGGDEWKPIIKVHRFDNKKKTLEIFLSNGKSITCSADHKFFYNNEWIEIEWLLHNANPKDYQNGFNTYGVDVWVELSNEDCPYVYDITVEDNHNYYLDCGYEILVHNSGKTYSTIQNIWGWMEEYNGVTYSIIRQSLPTLKSTVLVDFKDIGIDAGLYSTNNHNLTEGHYAHKGNKINFFSGDDEEKIRGRKQNVLYMNEAPELGWEAVNQLLFRTDSKVIIDYNPSYPDSWVYDNILTRKNCAFIRTTYKDNPFVTEAQIEHLEWMKENDPDGYIVFGLGQRGGIKGQIYNNWKRIDDKVFPRDANVVGIDFGFSNDPTAIGLQKFDKRTIYSKQLVYQTGLSNIDIAIHLFFNGIYDYHTIIADSAEPKSIGELRNGWDLGIEFIKDRVAELGFEFRNSYQVEKLHKYLINGLTIVGAVKGQDSIRNGIQKLKQFEVLMTEGSKNAWEEYTRYKYKLDSATGRATRQPVDAWNHFCDQLRYCAMSEGRAF